MYICICYYSIWYHSVIRNRYTGSRDTINIIHKKINLSNETNQLHPRQTSIRYDGGFEKKRLRLIARNWNAFLRTYVECGD